MTIAKKPAYWLFSGAALSIYSVVFLVSRSPRALGSPGRIALAGMFDLAITTAIVFYFLAVRPGYASRLTLATISLAGLRLASVILPSVDEGYLTWSKWLTVPLEITLVGALVARVRSKEARGDTLQRLRLLTASAIPYRRLSLLLAGEMAMLYYALFSWRANPEIEVGYRAYDCAEASGFGFFGTLLILFTLCEGVPVHIVVAHHSPLSAWILTAASLYGLLWALALSRAARLRSVLLNGEGLKIRIASLWDVDIRRTDIKACRRLSLNCKLPENCLKAVVINEPQYLLELSRPAIATGWYGGERSVSAIAIAVDDKEGFGRALGL